jgi:hypothetical protein
MGRKNLLNIIKTMCDNTIVNNFFTGEKQIFFPKIRKKSRVTSLAIAIQHGSGNLRPTKQEKKHKLYKSEKKK